ncbi:MAG TPA: hypothetical protein PLJ85_02865 [Candidatus Cloacimonas sp.]|nr:hypothetical protein [Candidatus Cloacimonas sp.]
MPNSDSANAVRHTFLRSAPLLAKKEFANPLKVCELFGKERIC